MIIPNIWKNKECSKPPTSNCQGMQNSSIWGWTHSWTKQKPMRLWKIHHVYFDHSLGKPLGFHISVKSVVPSAQGNPTGQIPDHMSTIYSMSIYITKYVYHFYINICPKQSLPPSKTKNSDLWGDWLRLTSQSSLYNLDTGWLVGIPHSWIAILP